MPDPIAYRFESPDSPLPLTADETRRIRGFFRLMTDRHREGKILLFATPEQAASLTLFADQTVIDMRELERSVFNPEAN